MHILEKLMKRMVRVPNIERSYTVLHNEYR